MPDGQQSLDIVAVLYQQYSMTMFHTLPAALLLAAAPALAQDHQHSAGEGEAMQPLRQADGASLVSLEDPAVRIALPETAVHIGAVRWPLYDVVDAELHVFVEADAHGLVQRFWWVQFESYFPDNEHRYDYPQSNPETVELDGHTVHVRPGISMGNPPEMREGSDGFHFRQLVAAAGYRLPTYTANVRFVELFEPTLRKEMMIIYGENMDAVITQMGAAQMQGRESFAFAEIYPPLIERALASIDLLPLD